VDIYTLLPALLSTIETSARNVAALFLGNGQWLLNALTVIVLVWAAMKTLLEQGELTDIIAEVIHTVMAWGFIAWILRNYDGFTDPLLNTFNDISRTIVGMPPVSLDGSPNASARTIYAGLAGFFDVVNHLTGAMGTVWNGLTWYQFIGNIQPIATGMIILGATVVIMYLAAGVYFVVYASSALLLAIGVGLGPLFLPWFVFRPTRGFFDGWIRFVAQAGLYKVVGAMLLVLTGPMIDKLKEFMLQIYPPGGGQTLAQTAAFNSTLIAGSTMICLIAILIAGMMAMAPFIASALMGGKLVTGGRMPIPKGPNVSVPKSATGPAASKPANGANLT